VNYRFNGVKGTGLTNSGFPFSFNPKKGIFVTTPGLLRIHPDYHYRSRESPGVSRLRSIGSGIDAGPDIHAIAEISSSL